MVLLFIWDFVADAVLGQIFDWVYGKIVEFLGEFFSMMNGMGSELFEFVWVQAVVEFFRYFGWALYAVGLVVAVFEAALEYQSGRTTAIRDLALGSLKGFLAASLFTTVPVEQYKLCIDLQGSLSSSRFRAASRAASWISNARTFPVFPALRQRNSVSPPFPMVASIQKAPS